MSKVCPKLAVLCFTLVLAGLSPVFAESTTYTGCLECTEKTSLTIPRDYCSSVDPGGKGYSKCTEETINLSRFCSVSGTSCEVSISGGGGGGGWSGGGGSGSCTILAGQLCPAECFSCEVNYF
jgi:hypothetical protein